MRVVIIGSGGREHAIALKLSESEFLEKLYIIPGNPGTAQIATNIDINIKNKDEIVNFCINSDVNLVVIGPEQPLVDGLANTLRENDIYVFAPDKEAAEIEANKSFAKKIMQKAGVPTAGFIEFTPAMYEHAKDFLKSKKYPCVIKANGLAAGKGVIICSNYNEAETALKNILIDKKFGDAGNKVLIEEFLEGEEASVFAITDGEKFVCLPAAQDHKRIGDGDTGKNTGGMGAYAPAPLISDELLNEIKLKIIQPTLKAMAENSKKFIGCLYAGLMITNEGPKVVEFNCRFGDPETQVVLPLLKGDLFKLLYSAATGSLDEKAVEYSGGSAVCVVAASGGYPDSYQKGFEIFGLDNHDEDIIIYHAGTKKEGDKILTNGGRVIGVTSVLAENNLLKAKEKAYIAINKINFQNMYYRKDIADKAIK